MPRIENGLYFIAADLGVTQLLEPANSIATISSTGSIPDLLANLNTPESSVWKLEMVPQGSRRSNFFSITNGDSVSLALNETTGGVYLDNIIKSDDRQLWDLRSMGYISSGAKYSYLYLVSILF